jgi:hypothetical protein
MDISPPASSHIMKGNTEGENNGYVVFNKISTGQLGNRLAVRGKGHFGYSALPHPYLQQAS